MSESKPKSKSMFTARYRLMRRLLREARQTNGITQPELARLLGKPKSYPAKIELGDRRLDAVELIDYAEALGIDPVALYRMIVKADKKS